MQVNELPYSCYKLRILFGSTVEKKKWNNMAEHPTESRYTVGPHCCFSPSKKKIHLAGLHFSVKHKWKELD